MVPGKKACLCKWDNHESSALLLSLILAGDIPAAVERQPPTQLCWMPCYRHTRAAGSLTRGSAHRHRKMFTSSFTHTPVILLAHKSTENVTLDFSLSFGTYVIESTTVEPQCASRWPSLQTPFSDIIGTSMALPRQSLEQWYENWAFIFCQFRGLLEQDRRKMRFWIEWKQENTRCLQILGELVSSLHGNAPA